MHHHRVLFIALGIAAACGKNDAPAAAPSAKPSAEVPALGAETPLAKAIAAVDACKSDEDCEAKDVLETAADKLSPDGYRAAMKVARTKTSRGVLTRAVADQMDASLRAELIAAANGCKEGEDCEADDLLIYGISVLRGAELGPAMNAAKTDRVRGVLLLAASQPSVKPDDGLIAVAVPYLTSEECGHDARELLEAIGSEAALGRLVALLDDHSREDSAHTDVPELLAKHPDSAVVKAAVPRLREMAKHDQQVWGRARAALAVGAIEKQQAIPFLIEFVKTDSFSGGREAVLEEGLAGYKTNPQVAALIKQVAASDRDDAVRRAAAKL
jgi:hypothetical protein